MTPDESTLFFLINKERKRLCLKPLELNQGLGESARQRSQVIKNMAVLSPNKSSTGGFAQIPRNFTSPLFTHLAELIGVEYNTDKVFKNFLRYSAHSQYISSEIYTHVGISVMGHTQGFKIFTLHFGGPAQPLNADHPCEIGPLRKEKRLQKALEIRVKAALSQTLKKPQEHSCNRDETLFPNKIGSFSKGLPHNCRGEVNLEAYQALIKALSTGKPADLEAIPMGGTAKLANPQAAYAFDLVGPDCHQLTLEVAPSFSSSWEASEMAELYWQALTRDVPFVSYDSDELALAAAADLSSFSDFRGPKKQGVVTTETLFRGDAPGELAGPYLSQFLWQDIPFGSTTIPQRYRTTLPGDDHMTTYEEWLNIQNGLAPQNQNKFDPLPRYIRNGRDLGEYVHRDFTYQAFLGAALILVSYGPRALAPSNPYLKSFTQGGFVTFGPPHILDFVSRAARLALEAAWFHKFLVHRRLRPEEFGGRVHNHLSGAACYPINQELLTSPVLTHIYKMYGSYLLPQAYAEGCPLHPAYPAGHASIAGAAVTILKAFFDESFLIPHPVQANADGTFLFFYLEHPLTIGGELNKLAANIALGRDTAGVHWRSDGIEGLKLGEAAAIGLLQDYKTTYNEKFEGFSLTKFDGTKIII